MPKHHKEKKDNSQRGRFRNQYQKEASNFEKSQQRKRQLTNALAGPQTSNNQLTPTTYQGLPSGRRHHCNMCGILH